MNIHKFNIKPKDKQHKTIKWMIPADIRQYVKKVNTNTWEIFSQENIKLKPKEVKHLFLGIGFMMSEGVVLTSLANSLSEKRCSIQNEDIRQVFLLPLLLLLPLLSLLHTFLLLPYLKLYLVYHVLLS